MSLPRGKRTLFAACAFGGLLVLEVAWLGISGWKLAQEKRHLKTQYRHLSRLQHRNPFPSQESVDTLHSNLDELGYRVQALSSEMNKDAFPRDAVEAADFSARAQGVVERFLRRAGHAGVVLPESMEVGFADYASGGAVPEARYVSRLTRQLYSVERVADLLVQSGVQSITMIDRERFEREDTAQVMPVRRSRRDSGRASHAPRVASGIGPDELYLIERVRVSFVADETAVWRMMDLIASAPHFMSVSSFSHKTLTRILDYNPDAVKAGSDDETMRFLSEGILTGESALSRPERIISGNDPVAVDLVVEVYNFNLESTEE